MARNSKSKNQKKKEINDQLAKMKFVKFLGKGSFGLVHLLRYPKPDGSMFYNAVKISATDRYDSLDREFQILTKLKGCPNIIQCFHNTLIKEFNGNKIYKMVMEYASAGSVISFMERNKTLSDTTIRDFTRMILQGLVSVHSHGYVHCDLKPDNLLLFPLCGEEGGYDLKISDFGMSTKAGEVSEYWRVHSPFVGTPVYMSPESVQDGVVEKTLDLWSLGCVVLEMYTGKQPWWEVKSIDIGPNLLNNVAPEIPETVPCDARKFLETCFARIPEERGSASELLLHPFLTRGDKQPWSELESIGPNLLDNAAPEIPDTVPCDARIFIETCFPRIPEERGSASELLLHPFLTREDKTRKKSPFYCTMGITKLFTYSNLGSLLLYFCIFLCITFKLGLYSFYII